MTPTEKALRRAMAKAVLSECILPAVLHAKHGATQNLSGVASLVADALKKREAEIIAEVEAANLPKG